MKDFVFTLLAWLLTLPFIVVAVVFALYNAEIVAVSVSPFRLPLPMPLYVPVLAGVAFGFAFGTVMTWAAMSNLRKERRDYKRKIKSLEKRLETSANPVPARHNYALIPSAFLDRK